MLSARSVRYTLLFAAAFALGDVVVAVAQPPGCVPPYKWILACAQSPQNDFNERAFDADIAADIDGGSTITESAFKAVHTAHWGSNFTAAVQEWNAINTHFSVFERSSCSSARSASQSPICARMHKWSHWLSAGHDPLTVAIAEPVAKRFGCDDGLKGSCHKDIRMRMNGGIWFENTGCGVEIKDISSILGVIEPPDGDRGQHVQVGRSGDEFTLRTGNKWTILHELGHAIGFDHVLGGTCRPGSTIMEQPRVFPCVFDNNCGSVVIKDSDVWASRYLYGGP